MKNYLKVEKTKTSPRNDTSPRADCNSDRDLNEVNITHIPSGNIHAHTLKAWYETGRQLR